MGSFERTKAKKSAAKNMLAKEKIQTCKSTDG